MREANAAIILNALTASTTLAAHLMHAAADGNEAALRTAFMCVFINDDVDYDDLYSPLAIRYATKALLEAPAYLYRLNAHDFVCTTLEIGSYA